VNRAQFQKLAKLRIREANALLKVRMFDGAYYLAGYAVECGLKSCIAKLTKRHDFPDKDLARNSYTHDFSQLIRTAELGDRFRIDLDQDLQFAANWTIVKDRKEDSRYATWTSARAKALIEAITETDHGVLPWIERQW
jgi:HEPN domain-containing protein